MRALSLYFREIQNVECVLIDSFIILLLLLWLLATKYIGEKKKAGNFNRGGNFSSPHTGYELVFFGLTSLLRPKTLVAHL